MEKILVMTDLHLVRDNQTIIGLDPLARLNAALDHAQAHQADAARLVLLGDLTHYGSSKEYAQLRAALADRPWSVSFLLGNHDRRAAFLAAFPEVHPDADGFLQSVVDLGGLRLITLDTLDEGGPVRHAGYLCPARLAWLEQALSTDQSCLVFLHHPPFETGFSGMDAIGLRNAGEVRALLKGRAAHVFAGHIHRTITASVDGLSLTTFKSPCHQMPMMLGQEGSGHSVDEPGGYGIVLADPSQVVVHFEDVLQVVIGEDQASR